VDENLLFAFLSSKRCSLNPFPPLVESDFIVVFVLSSGIYTAASLPDYKRSLDDRLIRIAFEKFDDNFHTDTRNNIIPQRFSPPRLRDAHQQELPHRIFPVCPSETAL
jgi:hypothetical protein